MMAEQDRGWSCRARAWRPVPVDAAALDRLVAEVGVSPVVARILLGRGITTADDARRFLEPDLARDWLSPDVIPGMSDAARRLADAIGSGEQIVVFGDFDLDGISSAALAATGIRLLEGRVTATVPHRFREGYGLTPASVERLRGMAPDLVVTVDCGISGGPEVADLKADGIDVVITDHHEPGDAVPQGVPVADPKLDPGCPSRDLSGAGVALKLVQAT
ncbi:MAG: DHH family phosphoesterase, partial [Coriobacteriia bacterium]|nr:DHH family phosphoesterase [Coriobacteriia bacterium]